MDRNQASPGARRDVLLAVVCLTAAALLWAAPRIQQALAVDVTVDTLPLPDRQPFQADGDDLDDAVRVIAQLDDGTEVRHIARFPIDRPLRFALSPDIPAGPADALRVIVVELGAVTGLQVLEVPWPHPDGRAIVWESSPFTDGTVDLAIYGDGRRGVDANGWAWQRRQPDGTIGWAEAHVDLTRPRIMWEEIYQAAGPAGDGDRPDSILSTVQQAEAPTGFDQWVLASLYRLPDMPADADGLRAALAALS